MKNKIGITFIALTILSIPNQVFAELEFDSKSYHYGFFAGSLSESCILYKYGDITAKVLRETYESIFSSLKEEDNEVQKEVLRFSKNKKFPCKDFIPYSY
tara:strand:- start:280 stop:579 length:300 start_codon:yes stop_codon:yes gene_type:complete